MSKQRLLIDKEMLEQVDSLWPEWEAHPCTRILKQYLRDHIESKEALWLNAFRAGEEANTREYFIDSGMVQAVEDMLELDQIDMMNAYEEEEGYGAG